MAIYPETDWNEVELDYEPLDADRARRRRILTSLGRNRGGIPQVTEENLERYYRYLSENLTFPFSAHYPEVTHSVEEELHRCSICELLDPSEHQGDPFDGLICKTRKGDFQVNLPLVELEVPHEDPNFQMVEDYWYWFWNWR